MVAFREWLVTGKGHQGGIWGVDAGLIVELGAGLHGCVQFGGIHPAICL